MKIYKIRNKGRKVSSLFFVCFVLFSLVNFLSLKVVSGIVSP